MGFFLRKFSLFYDVYGPLKSRQSFHDSFHPVTLPMQVLKNNWGGGIVGDDSEGRPVYI